MLKMLTSFVFVFAIFYFGIDMFRQFTGKQRLSFMKNAAYAAGVSVLSILFLIVIVLLF